MIQHSCILWIPEYDQQSSDLQSFCKSEDTRQSAIRRLSAEAGFEVESSKEMFEKIMGRTCRIDNSTSRGRIRGSREALIKKTEYHRNSS